MGQCYTSLLIVHAVGGAGAEALFLHAVDAARSEHGHIPGKRNLPPFDGSLAVRVYAVSLLQL